MRIVVLLVAWLWLQPAHADEVSRIRGHLVVAHGVIAARDVSALSPAQQAARATSLAHLWRYIARGEFPRRTADAFGARQPRFIDDRGVHCAVGQMIADSGEPALARAINARFEYAFVRDMREPALHAWAEQHGFTVAELALIQPSYSAVPDEHSTKSEMLERIPAFTLACAAQHPPMESLLVHVAGDRSGRAVPTSQSQDPFARCIVGKLATVQTGGGAYMGQPKRYLFGMNLTFPSPQALLEQRMARWTPNCSPLPGALSRSVRLDVNVGASLAITAMSSPANPLVDACVKREATQAFSDFTPGTWRLHARSTLRIAPRVQVSAQLLTSLVEPIAPECDPTPTAATATISVRAAVDADAFSISVSGSPEFAACVTSKLDAALRSQFRTSYQATPDAPYTPYFRIDAKVDTRVTVKLESKAARDTRMEKLRQEMELERERHRYGY